MIRSGMALIALCAAPILHTNFGLGIMPKSTAERMREMRARKLARGLVKVEFYLTPEQAEKVRAYVKRMGEKK